VIFFYDHDDCGAQDEMVSMIKNMNKMERNKRMVSALLSLMCRKWGKQENRFTKKNIIDESSCMSVETFLLFEFIQKKQKKRQLKSKLSKEKNSKSK